MHKECILKIHDEVNCSFDGLDTETRRKLVQSVEYFLPHARYSVAYKLGRWKGTTSFCDIGGRSYFNILDKLLPIVQDNGYRIEIDDQRINYDIEFEKVDQHSYSHVNWPVGHALAGQPIILRDHQVELINNCLSDSQGISVCSTAGGKTIAVAILSHKIEKYGRSLIIVPSKDLVGQTEKDYINLGLDVGVYFGDRKELNKTHTICTWQSLEVLNKKSKYFDPEVSLEDFIDGVAGIIVDECHRISKNLSVLQKLLTREFSHIPIRWGVTGTIPKEEYIATSLIVSLGPVLGTITAKELQDKGVLSNLNINILQYQDPVSVFANYQAELKWLTTDNKRLKVIAKKIEEISQTGNTLVLVDRIETGKFLEKLLPGSIFVSGEMKVNDRKDEYEEIKTIDNKILICTFGVASTGLDLVRLFNLVLVEPGKSFIRIIQSIGRGLRKAGDKDWLNVYDVCSISKYSKKHLTERKKWYKEAQYPFEITKENYS
jgi:superfamily II DNA or RNA helicase